MSVKTTCTIDILKFVFSNVYSLSYFPIRHYKYAKIIYKTKCWEYGLYEDGYVGIWHKCWFTKSKKQYNPIDKGDLEAIVCKYCRLKVPKKMQLLIKLYWLGKKIK